MDEQAALTFFETVITPEMGVLTVACWAVLESLRRLVPKLEKSSVWWHVLPILPELIGVGLAMIPVAAAEGAGIGDRILLGIIAGALASKGRKVIKRRFEWLFDKERRDSVLDASPADK